MNFMAELFTVGGRQITFIFWQHLARCSSVILNPTIGGKCYKMFGKSKIKS